jgi:hypothetical protein
MADLGDMSRDELVEGAHTFEAALTRQLIDALEESSKKINCLTRWLIGFTIALVVVGVATLAVTLWD